MKIAKIIGLILLVLVPVSITTFIGFYSYDRYKPAWLPDYLSKAATTEEKIERLVRFDSISHTIDPVYTHTHPNHLFKLAVYGRLIQSLSVTPYVEYVVYMYAIDYNELPETEKPIALLTYGEDITSSLTFGYETRFVDKEATPPDESPDNAVYMTYRIAFGANADMAGKVSIKIYTGVLDTETYELLLDDEITGIIHNQNTFKTSTETVDGLNLDIEAGGYSAFVFSSYIWWQCLITLLISGALSYLFYLVWHVDYVPTQPGPKKPPTRH